MTPSHAGNIVILVDFDSCGTKPSDERVIFATTQSRVRLLGRAEILLHPKVDLYAPALEPAPTTPCQFRRFVDLNHAEQVPIKAPCLFLLANGHRELHVINNAERTIEYSLMMLLTPDP